MDDVDKDFFKMFKKDKDNNVSVNDLTNYLVMRYNKPRPIMLDTVKWYDIQKTGKINKKQYTYLMKTMRSDHFSDKDLNNFDAFDLNRNGFIDAFTLFCVLNNMNVPTLYGTAVEMIRKADKDNDNKINHKEFKNLFK